MPGPTDELQVAVSSAVRAAAGWTDVTADRSSASTSAATFATDSTRISGPTLRVSRVRTRLGGARHAPGRIDERDPGLTRLEEELSARAVEERELVEHPVALPGAIDALAVPEHRHRAAAGHPVVEAHRAEAVLLDLRRPDVGGHHDDVLREDRAAPIAVHGLHALLRPAVPVRGAVPGVGRGPGALERDGQGLRGPRAREAAGRLIGVTSRKERER